MPSFAPLVLYAFGDLRVSAAVWEHGTEWWSIHTEPNLEGFEVEHSVDTERNLYNEQHFAQVRKQRRTVRGEHGGYSDSCSSQSWRGARSWPFWSPDPSSPLGRQEPKSSSAGNYSAAAKDTRRIRSLLRTCRRAFRPWSSTVEKSFDSSSS